MQEYSSRLEKSLNLSSPIDGCKKLFDLFLIEQSIIIKTEVKLLETIKLFLHRKKHIVRSLNSANTLRNGDCLTLSIITCLLASKYGYYVTIGKPKPMLSYFHSVIITSEGKMFKVAGKRSDYEFHEMGVSRVIWRFQIIYPIITFANYIKKLRQEKS